MVYKLIIFSHLRTAPNLRRDIQRLQIYTPLSPRLSTECFSLSKFGGSVTFFAVGGSRGRGILELWVNYLVEESA